MLTNISLRNLKYNYMKSVSLFIVGLCMTICLFAQEENTIPLELGEESLYPHADAQNQKWVLDSIHNWSYTVTGSSFITNRVLYHDFTKYGKPKKISRFSRLNEDEEWLNYLNTHFTYFDGEGLESQTDIRWDYDSQSLSDTIWVKLYNKDGFIIESKSISGSFGKYIKYHLNSDNLNDSISFYEWNSQTMEWVIDQRWKNFVYDDKGIERSRELYDWDPIQNVWKTIRRSTRYDSEVGYAYVDQIKEDNSDSWINHYRKEYILNSDNNLIIYSNQSWSDVGETWVTRYKQEIEYNNQKQRIKVVISNDNNFENKFRFDTKSEYEYDENNKISKSASFIWHIVKESWDISSRKDYYWSEKDVWLSDVEEIERQEIAAFPNPAVNYIQLGKEVNLTSNVASIYSSTGKLVKKSSISDTNSIGVMGMTTGQYIIVLEVSGRLKSIPFIKK